MCLETTKNIVILSQKSKEQVITMVEGGRENLKVKGNRHVEQGII